MAPSVFQAALCGNPSTRPGCTGPVRTPRVPPYRHSDAFCSGITLRDAAASEPDAGVRCGGAATPLWILEETCATLTRVSVSRRFAKHLFAVLIGFASRKRRNRTRYGPRHGGAQV